MAGGRRVSYAGAVRVNSCMAVTKCGSRLLARSVSVCGNERSDRPVAVNSCYFISASMGVLNNSVLPSRYTLTAKTMLAGTCGRR